MDKTILAEGTYSNKNIPNQNVAVFGCSGAGKSLSFLIPNLLNTKSSSIIANFAKPKVAYKMALYFKKNKQYKVNILDLNDCESSNVFFDPIKLLKNTMDIVSFSSSVVSSSIKITNDEYWQKKAIDLLAATIALSIGKGEENMSTVFKIFEHIKPCEESLFDNYKETLGYGIEITEYLDFANRMHHEFFELPNNTASCVKDTLAAVLNDIFPEPIRNSMNSKKLINFKEMANKKTALFIICSPADRCMNSFMALVYDMGLKELLKFAHTFSEGKLPVNIRMFFDEFGVTPIKAFSEHISIIRSAGISVSILLQSLYQLQAIYGDKDSANILQNCSTMLYYPGGLDLETCKYFSYFLNIPTYELLYAPIGNVYIVQSGNTPICKERYQTYEDPNYKQFKH